MQLVSSGRVSRVSKHGGAGGTLVYLRTLVDFFLDHGIVLLPTVIDYRRAGYRGLGVGLRIEEVGVERQAALWRRGRRCHALGFCERRAVPEVVGIQLAEGARSFLVWSLEVRPRASGGIGRASAASWYKAGRREMELQLGGAEPIV